MAEKRMFSLQVVDTDAFLEMPLSSQALYFHLSMRADDDGFVNNPNKIMRMINASKNDYDILMLKRFIIPFDNGICVIKHWRLNNYIQKDRYKPTNYIEQKKLIEVKENNVYTLKKPLDTDCIQDVSELDTQIRLDKSRLDKSSIDILPDATSSTVPPLPPPPKKSSYISKSFALSTIEQSELSAEIKTALKNWLEYKAYKYKDAGFTALLSIVAKKVEKFGEDAVVSIVEESMSNTWSGVCWDKLEKNKTKLTTGKQDPFQAALAKEEAKRGIY